MEDYKYLQKMINLCMAYRFLDIFEGIVITDRRARILYCDEKHSLISGHSQAEEIGNSIVDLNNCYFFPKVIETGIPIIGKRFSIREKDFFGSVIPLKRRNIVIGAMGVAIFSNIEGLKGLLDLSDFKCSDLQNEISKDVNIDFESIIGVSKALKNIKELAFKASQLDIPILLEGETGTGKSMFAKAIHNASPRRNYPFVTVNCAAIPKDLFETELFGYAPGAFSGASPKGKPGKLEIAHRGTILLDEIGNLPLEFQVKLLDVLQEKQMVRIGDIKPLNIDFRLITATSEDLEKMVHEKLFRSDFYFRINVIKIHLPPLRERREDLPILIQYKLKDLMEKYRLKQGIHIEEDLIKYLTEYSFPGNVRELFNPTTTFKLKYLCSIDPFPSM